MRRLLVAFTIAASPIMPVQAAGAWDGIYSCGFSVAGYFHNVYLTVNGQPDGRAIFAVAAVSSYNPFYGYGIGVVSGNPSSTPGARKLLICRDRHCNSQTTS